MQVGYKISNLYNIFEIKNYIFCVYSIFFITQNVTVLETNLSTQEGNKVTFKCYEL